MQTFGAGSATSAAAMFGAAGASESNAVEFASQISAAIQNSEVAVLGTDSPWRLAQTSSLEAYSAADFDALTGIDSFAPDLATAVQAIQASAPAPAPGIDAIEDTDAFAAFAEGFVAGAQPQTEGIPGLQLLQLTGLELSSLIESGQLQPANGDIAGGQPASNDLFLFAASAGASNGQPVRLIPIAQLEAFNIPADGVDLAANFAVANQVIADVAAAVASQQTTAQEGSAKPINGELPQATAATPDTAIPNTTQVANAAIAASSSTPPAPAPAVNATPQDAEAKSANDETSTSSTVKPVADDLAQKTTNDKAVEGHLVQANKQAVAEQSAKAGKQQVQAQATQGQTNNPQSAMAANQASAAATASQGAAASKGGPATKSTTPSSTEQQRIKHAGTFASRKDQVAAAARMSTPITWNPEQLAGIPESAVLPEAVAGGLSGLRGEPGFMNSMGLMGHKAASTLTGPVTTQVNLQITKAVKNGTSEFNMRLNPSELGSVRVKMSFNEAGRVSAQLFAERPETLELLQREMRGIERAVEAGGHKVEQGGISFNLDTDDGQSAGKAFADAARQDQLKDQIADGQGVDGDSEDDMEATADLTDLAMLEDILSRVTPDTGLDVRV